MFKISLRVSFFMVALMLSSGSAAFGQGTAFTYQGKLADNGNPANGHYDFQFGVFAGLGVLARNICSGVVCFARRRQVPQSPNRVIRIFNLNPHHEEVPIEISTFSDQSSVPSGSGNYIQNGDDFAGEQQFQHQRQRHGGWHVIGKETAHTRSLPERLFVHDVRHLRRIAPVVGFDNIDHRLHATSCHSDLRIR